MTDDKKELPWQRYSPLGVPEPEVCYLVPSSEAIRLHALDERVKKFEEAAQVSLEYFKIIRAT